jgi:LCP family protein required for cell wall assembly
VRSGDRPAQDISGHDEWESPADQESVPSTSRKTLAAGDDLDVYVRSIEEAAFRQQVEQRGQRTAAITAAPVHTGTQVAAPVRTRSPRGRRRQQQKKPFFRRRRTWFGIALLIPIIAVIGITLYLLNIVRVSYSAYQEIHEEPVEERVRYRVNPEGTPEPIPSAQVENLLPNWDEDEPFNMVLLGVDERDGDDDPPRSDTTIVVHVDPKNKRVTMMSIPRDVLVHIPGFGNDKMNAAYPLGEAHEDEIPGGGPTLVAQTIEANFNIPIHYYATINFEGFIEMVDTLGGIVVDVQVPLSDNLYPTDDLRVTRVYFHTGLQKLDGTQALRYVRTRHSDSDIGRGIRQQQVLVAMREQAIDLGLITRAPELIEKLGHTLRTDLNLTQMLALANLGRGVESDDITQINLWEEGALTEHFPEFEGDAYYLIPNWPLIFELQASSFDISQPDESGSDTANHPNLDTPIVVENATDHLQLAGHSVQILFDAGFTAVWPADADELSDTTAIYDYTGDLATAQYVAEMLGIPDAAIIRGTDGEGIIVTLGSDVPERLIPPQPEE